MISEWYDVLDYSISYTCDASSPALYFCSTFLDLKLDILSSGLDQGSPVQGLWAPWAPSLAPTKRFQKVDGARWDSPPAELLIGHKICLAVLIKGTFPWPLALQCLFQPLPLLFQCIVFLISPSSPLPLGFFCVGGSTSCASHFVVMPTSLCPNSKGVHRHTKSWGLLAQVLVLQ